jgi:tetratricopeptide (TPR) repeat protein/S1-C subfamily serine protease
MHLTKSRDLFVIGFVILSALLKIEAQVELSAREIARNSLPSVVLIICDDGNDIALGSGFFIRPGILVTNYHVIEGMSRGIIQVAFGIRKEKRNFRIARIVAFDKEADLALLSVPGSKDAGIRALPMVQESYEIEVGETVYALGNPEGMVGTISLGIVSAGIRSTQKKSRIQISAPISHGSSGGPVVNGWGKVIGVTVGFLSEGQNLNFAVPFSLVYPLIRNAEFPDDQQSAIDTKSDRIENLPAKWEWPGPKVPGRPVVSGKRTESGSIGENGSAATQIPRTASDYFFQGLRNLDDGKYAQAISDNTRAIQLNPKLAAAYINRGLAYGKQGKYELEIVDCTMAIRINPRLPEAYINRGVGYLERGKYDLAVADNTKAIQINSQFAVAYNNRGNAYRKQRKFALAIADYTMAIQTNPQYDEAYFNRGNAHSNEGRYDLAIADYTKAIEINPNYAKAYFNRGNSYDEEKGQNSSIRDYTMAIQIDPRFEEPYLNRAQIYKRQGKYDLAIADFTMVIQINPKSSLAFRWRSEAYCSAGNIKLGLADQNRAKRLGDSHFSECRVTN